jgi:hypothetical protein
MITSRRIILVDHGKMHWRDKIQIISDNKHDEGRPT